jgi:hypothetical protein
VVDTGYRCWSTSPLHDDPTSRRHGGARTTLFGPFSRTPTLARECAVQTQHGDRATALARSRYVRAVPMNTQLPSEHLD